MSAANSLADHIRRATKMSVNRLALRAVFALLPFSAQAEVSFKLDARGHTIAILGLTSPDDEDACLHASFFGRVVHREFESNAVTLKAFVIEHQDGTRDYIN